MLPSEKYFFSKRIKFSHDITLRVYMWVNTVSSTALRGAVACLLTCNEPHRPAGCVLEVLVLRISRRQQLNSHTLPLGSTSSSLLGLTALCRLFPWLGTSSSGFASDWSGFSSPCAPVLGAAGLLQSASN